MNAVALSVFYPASLSYMPGQRARRVRRLRTRSDFMDRSEIG